VVFSFNLQVHRPGWFSDSATLYVDNGGLQEIHLAVKGEAKLLSASLE